MITTCGIFLINKYNQILIGHPTGMSPLLWSIPKGVQEPCESPLKTAWREVTEETGIHRNDIVLNVYRFRRSMLGCAHYTEKPKRIIAYGYKFDGVLDKTPVCNSTFFCKATNQRLPEVDRWKWLDYKKAYKYLNDTQKSLLRTAIKLGVFK